MTRKTKNVLSASLAGAIQNQKYSLQRRDKDGAFRKVSTFDTIVTKEKVLSDFGDGYYVFRVMKPRIRTIWKGRLGEDEASKINAIERRTKILTFGLVGAVAAQAVGFGISAWQFLKLISRVKRLEVVMQAFKPNLKCNTCEKPLDHFLQPFCSQCGSAITWPEDHLPSMSTANCFRCSFPLQLHQSFCPACGQPRPIQVAYKFERGTFRQVV